MKSKILLSIITALLVFPAATKADYGFDFSKAGSAGLQFLKIGAGGRATALGGAVTSTASDANAIFWNPAGIASVRRPECMMTYNDWLVDSRYTALAVAYPFGSTVIALSAIDFGISEFEETTVLMADGSGNMITAGDTQLGIGLAHRFSDRVKIGVQIKYIQERLAEYTHENYLFDIGTVYNSGFRDLTFGFAFQHFGPDMQFANQLFRAPLLFRVGISDALINTKFHKLTLSIDRVHPTDNMEWMNYGLEYEIKNLIFFRAGYRQDRDLDDMSFGIGLKLPSIGKGRLRIDYSTVDYGEIFGNINRVTIGLSL